MIGGEYVKLSRLVGSSGLSPLGADGSLLLMIWPEMAKAMVLGRHEKGSVLVCM